MQLSTEFKNKVVAALLEARKKFGGSDAAFAKQYDINGSVYSQIKNGKDLDGLLRDTQWLQMGRELGVTIGERKWNMVRTEVFNTIEEEVIFCKENSKSRILVDDTDLGKTFTAKHLSKAIDNCFYLDCSQAKTKQHFVRSLAKVIGVDNNGKFVDVKANIKYYLQLLERPVIIIDEAGDLDYGAFLELKEFWNATENSCGWYMMGADGLRAYLTRGIKNQKVGFREIFSRYGNKYGRVTPVDNNERISFYRTLLTQVVKANATNGVNVSEIVNKCLAKDSEGHIGGLRRAESLLLLSTQKQSA